MAAAAEDYTAADRRGAARSYADDLLANTETLDERVQELDLHRRPDRQRRQGLLDEVATGKVTGEEEFWSHTDLWDFQANVDGARVALRGRAPDRSRRRTPSSPSTLDTRFAELQALLDSSATGDGFVAATPT